MRKTTALVVDDDPASLGFMSLALAEEFSEVRSATGGVEALLCLEASLPDLVVSDLRMPDLDGLELVKLVKERWPEVPVILVTVEQDVAHVVEAVKSGATDYLTKPVSPSLLCSTALRALAGKHHTFPVADRSIPEIIGSSPCMIRVRHLISVAAKSDVNVLISGETGTGKELVARAIHRLSNLSQGPFVAHNCAVSPQDLFESQFFGHRRGAFTGADRDHRGFLEVADDGILFLDELECLSPHHQAKLLRVIDDGQVHPVGSEESRTVSVRFLAATNQDPDRLMVEGNLREDLYYRLRGMEIAIPPLRERHRDILQLATHFLGASGITLDAGAAELLQTYPWPGNVRQLRYMLEGIRMQIQGGILEPRHVLPLVGFSSAPRHWMPSAMPAGIGRDRPSMEPPPEEAVTSLRSIEARALIDALRAAHGHKGRAARALGIHRSTLRRKMRELGIEVPL
jgi:DNA-binding NtrC family response regulator